MPTVIRRSTTTGDPLLPRAPFAEPGPKAVARLSALSFSGADGDIVDRVTDAEGAGVFGRSVGIPPVYKVAPSGVPSYEFDQAVAGGDPVMYLGGAGRVVKTQIFVGRVRRLGTESSGATSFSHLMRMNLAGYGALYLQNVGHATPGAIVAIGATTGETITGPQVEVGEASALHFFAAVWDGANSRLHYDNHVATGTLSSPANPVFTVGYNKNGSLFEVVEAAQYATALTRDEIALKLAHYRALYQF